MSQSKKPKGTLERVTEPVTGAAGAVVKTVKRSARGASREVGHVMKSIGEAVTEGAEAVKDAGARALRSVSGSGSSTTKSRESKTSAKKNASSPRASIARSTSKASSSQGRSTASKAKASKPTGMASGSGSKSKDADGKAVAASSSSAKKTKGERNQEH
jgi:hypothetical protein